MFAITLLELVALYSFYFLAKCVYRLTLHPLARFPGPKKAAMSRLYAMSWDLPIKTSYVKEFTTWHDKYDSPIVRIEPNHLHIRDIDAYNEIFKMGTKFSRDPVLYTFAFTKGSVFNKLGVKEGAAHRSLYTQAFSRARVQQLEPVIQLHLTQFLDQLEKSDIVDLTLGFRCLTADTVMRYCFNKPFGATLAKDFQDPLVVNIAGFFKNATVGWYAGDLFVKLVGLLQQLPRSWIKDEGISTALQILDSCNDRINELSKDPSGTHIFQTALNPGKNQVKLSNSDMGSDALVLFIAGTDTTANALTLGVYHLLRRPVFLRKLQDELDAAILTADYPLGWADLEKLPFLRAVCKEALRLSLGVPGKIPRVVPDGGATLAGQFIPGGTVVSSTAYAYHMNPEYFAEPSEFKPERWMESDAEKYFMPFSRGTRACLGSNLALAELHYAMAYTLHRFDLSLYKTTEKDMDWHDTFVTNTFGHLRVKVERREVRHV